MTPWLYFLAGMAALIWPVPLLYWWGADWHDRRRSERGRERIEEIEALEHLPWHQPWH